MQEPLVDFSHFVPSKLVSPHEATHNLLNVRGSQIELKPNVSQLGRSPFGGSNRLEAGPGSLNIACCALATQSPHPPHGPTRSKKALNLEQKGAVKHVLVSIVILLQAPVVLHAFALGIEAQVVGNAKDAHALAGHYSSHDALNFPGGFETTQSLKLFIG
jgi:hypothetical protein